MSNESDKISILKKKSALTIQDDHNNQCINSTVFWKSKVHISFWSVLILEKTKSMSHSGKYHFKKDSGKLEPIQGRVKRVAKSLETMKYKNWLRVAVADLEKVSTVDPWQSSSTEPLPPGWGSRFNPLVTLVCHSSSPTSSLLPRWVFKTQISVCHCLWLLPYE